MSKASRGLSSRPGEGLTTVLPLEAAGLAGGLLLTSPRRLGGWLLGTGLLHQLSGRLE